MASRVDTHIFADTRTYPHESDFKKPGAHWLQTGVRLVYKQPGAVKKGMAKQSRNKSIVQHLRWLVRTRADISLWPSGLVKPTADIKLRRGGLVRPRTDIKLQPSALVRTRTDIKLWPIGLVRSYKD